MDRIVGKWIVGLRFRWCFLGLLFDVFFFYYCPWFFFWNTFFFFDFRVIKIVFSIVLLWILSLNSVVLSKSFDYGFCGGIFKSYLNGWLMNWLLILKNVLDQLFLFLHQAIFTLMGIILTFFLVSLVFGINIITLNYDVFLSLKDILLFGLPHYLLETNCWLST